MIMPVESTRLARASRRRRRRGSRPPYGDGADYNADPPPPAMGRGAPPPPPPAEGRARRRAATVGGAEGPPPLPPPGGGGARRRRLRPVGAARRSAHAAERERVCQLRGQRRLRAGRRRWICAARLRPRLMGGASGASGPPPPPPPSAAAGRSSSPMPSQSNDLLSAIRGFGGAGAGGLRKVDDEARSPSSTSADGRGDLLSQIRQAGKATLRYAPAPPRRKGGACGSNAAPPGGQARRARRAPGACGTHGRAGRHGGRAGRRAGQPQGALAGSDDERTTRRTRKRKTGTRLGGTRYGALSACCSTSPNRA